MKNFNLVKLDSKGRILVPFHVRNQLELDDGMELVVVGNEKKEIKIFPLIKGKAATIHVMFSDVPGSLSKILNVISGNNIDILTSISRTLEKGELAEWSAIIDISRCNGNMKKLENNLSKLKVVKKIEVEEK
ncbi:MAG TPA: hypothetical protein VJB11_03115 [archaeon]|nr:hypothetical protein [archaeon]